MQRHIARFKADPRRERKYILLYSNKKCTVSMKFKILR